MRAADYPYPPDEFDAAAAGGPQGVHRRPRSAWSRAWPFLVVLVVLPALAYAAVTIASGNNPLTASTSSSSPSSSASASTPAGEETSATPTQTPTETPTPTPTAEVDLARAVTVQNATNRSGLASGAKDTLEAAGFTDVTSGNFEGTEPAASVVYYPAATDSATAAAVAAALGIAAVEESATTSPDGVLAVLAADYTP